MEIQDLKPILTSLIPQIEMRIKDIKYMKRKKEEDIQ